MKRCVVLIAAVILIAAGWADAQVARVEAVQIVSGESTFTLGIGTFGKGQLQMGFIYDSVTVYTQGGAELSFFNCAANATFDLYEDLTPTTAGNAMGYFVGVAWDIEVRDIFSGNMVVADMAGTIDWYEETEDPDDEGFLNGRGIAAVTQADFAGPLNNYVWSDGVDPRAGLRTTTTVNGGSIIDYQDPYASSMVTLTIISDWQSIPEPMTVVMLGLGSAALLRRRKRS